MQGRTQKSFYNVITGIFGQMFSFVLSFVIRTVFIHTLGEVYLGLDGLYSNILSVLSLTELGLGTAIVIELYRTVAEKNDEKTKQYLQFYKKAYNCIGGVILGAGLIITPFLHLFINDAEAVAELINYKFVFLFYLGNVSFSYFSFAYRLSILQAHQQEYKSRILTYIFKTGETILQIITLLIFKSIYAYLIIPLALGIVQTIVRGILIGKWFPIVKEKPEGKLSKDEVKTTAKNIYSVALYKISGTVINSTDNIILSSFISIVITGMYSNYLVITSAIKTILEKLFTAFIASLGNLNVEAGDDINKKYTIFKTLSFMNFWAYGFCAVCLFVLFDPFISIWIGDKFIMNTATEFMIVFDLLVVGLQETIGTHRAAYGLFYKGRYRPVFSVLLNIVLSILFVKVLPTEYGVVAVLLGTVLSNLCVSWWFDSYLVHKHAFNMKPFKFYGTYWLRMLYSILFCVGLRFGCNLIPLSGVLQFIVYALICFVVYNVFFVLFFYRKPEFIYLKDSVLRLLKRKTKQ